MELAAAGHLGDTQAGWRFLVPEESFRFLLLGVTGVVDKVHLVERYTQTMQSLERPAYSRMGEMS